MQSCYSNPHQMAAAAAAAAAASQNGGSSGDPAGSGPRLPFPINFPSQVPNMAGLSAAEIAASLQSISTASPSKNSSIASLDTNANSAMKRKNSTNQERTGDEMGGWGMDSDDLGSDDDDDDDEDEREAGRHKPVGGSSDGPRKEGHAESRASKTCEAAESAEDENVKERSGTDDHKDKTGAEERPRKRRASEAADNSENADVKTAKLGNESDEEENVNDDYDICSSRSPPPLMQTEIKVQRPLGLLAQHGLTVKPAGAGGGSMLPRNFAAQSYFNIAGLGPDRRMSADMDSDPESGRGRESDRETDSEQEILHSREMMQAAAAAAAAAAAGANREEFMHHFERQHMQHQKQDSKEHLPGMRSPSEGLDFSNHLSLMDRRFMPSPPPSTSPSVLDPNRTPPTSSSSGHHWTFEEQFKQLYEMSPEPKRKEFLDDLFTFMQKRGTPVNRIPIMAKQTLDLYELFRLVVSKGGLVEVINKKLWREITKGLNLPSSITSAAFTLRTQYMKYLYPYECEKLKLSSLAELQSAIDGNRREGRRPGYGYDFSPMPTMMSTPPTPHMNGASGMRPLNPSRSSTDDDRPMLSGPSVAAAAVAAHSQLRSLAEHDARAMEAATRAMEEVSKRMEEASRAAAMATGVMGTPTAAGSGPGRLMGGGPSLNMVGTKYEDAPPTIKRPPTGMFEDERFFAQMGMHSTHIKLSSRSNGRLEYDSSMVVSMEINGIMYQGVLFAQHPRRI